MNNSDRFSPRERRGIREYLTDRRVVFIVAYCGYAMCYVVRNNYRLTSAVIQNEYSISAVFVGTVLSAFSIAYGFGKLLMGVLVDRISMKWMLTFCLASSSLICALIPFFVGSEILVMLMILLGIVQGGGAPASLAMLNSWYPNATRGAAVSIWNTSQNLGAAVLAAASAFILSQLTHDWRLVFWVPAALTATLTICVFRYGRERPWQEGYPTLTEIYGRAGVPVLSVQPQESYWKLVLTTMTGSTILPVLIVLNAMLYFMRFGVINWASLYLTGERGYSVGHVQGLLSVMEIAAIPTVLGFAVIARRWPARMAVCGGISMVVLAAVLMIYGSSDIFSGAMWTFILLGGLIYAPQVIVNILTLNLTPPRMVGAAVGVVGLSGYLVGEVVANTLIPRYAQMVDWASVYQWMAVIALLAAVSYLFLAPYERQAVQLT